MKNYRLRLRGIFSLAGLLATAPLTQATEIIGSDDFDTSVEGTDYLTREINNPQNIQNFTFNIVNRDTLRNRVMIDTTSVASVYHALDPEDTSGFLDSTKTDHFFGIYRATGSLVYTFDISDYTNLNLAMDWITSNPFTPRIITVTASIDGGAEQDLFTTGARNFASTETFESGKILDRIKLFTTAVNGVAGIALSDSFQTYTPTISGNGSLLTLTIAQNNKVGTYGGYGLDKLVLSGDPATRGPLQLKIAQTGSDLNFEWNSITGVQYDLVSSSDLSTSPETWDIYDDGASDFESIQASGTGTNTLTGVIKQGPVSFFALRAKSQ